MDDRNQGGMTGATGSLTPSESEPEDEFVPAETREINDPHAARRITEETLRRAEERDEAQTDPPGPPPESRPIPSAGPILGGDERHDPEEEHF